MTRPPTPSAAHVVLRWDPAFRARMTVRAEDADDARVLDAAAEALPQEARDLLATLLIVAGAGEPVPDRFRVRIDQVGGPLWLMAALLPRVVPSEGTLVPTHYAGACRLNPALAGLDVLPARTVSTPPTASWPPTDARWDAVVLAALLETQPLPLTVEGAVRRDVERRTWQKLGGDERRWTLALQLARLTQLARPSAGKLVGAPEATPRPVVDPSALMTDPLRASAATMLWRRVPADGQWLDLRAELDQLREHARELLVSPATTPGARMYPSLHGLPSRPWDDAGWDSVERAWITEAADVFHRAGLVDAARDARGELVALRHASPPAGLPSGFMLLPDNDILVHPAELPRPAWGRLARMAPWVEGTSMMRHRLTREGVAADLAAGHTEPLGFLGAHSRTGVPVGVTEVVRDWERSATRVVVLTGVDLLEDATGALRRPQPGESVGARVIDYATPPRARFVHDPEGAGLLRVPVGADALTVRAALSRIARSLGRDARGEQVFAVELRAHRDVDALLEQLRGYYGGDLPGEVEALVRAGAHTEPVEAVPALMLRVPLALAPALRRDRVAGPILRRVVSDTESLVDAADVAALQARLADLGVACRGLQED